MATGDALLTHNGRVTIVHDETGQTFGPLRNRSGGGATAENQYIRPGGMGAGRSVPGPVSYEDLTGMLQITHEKDSGVVQKFIGWQGERFTIIHQPLDSKGRPGFHKPVTWGGRLSGVTPPEYDESGTDSTDMELTFGIDGIV